MNRYTVKRPIGLTAFCEEVERVCQNAALHQHCDLHPRHLIVPLDAGAGRTTLLEYMAGRYKETGVMPFTSGLDDYIELVLDGSLQQLKQVFAAIQSAAIYENQYTGIVGLDISNIADHLDETQLPELIKRCQVVCTTACVVFFVRSIPTKNEKQLIKKLRQSIANIKPIALEPYTEAQLSAIVLQNLDDRDVYVIKPQEFGVALTNLLQSLHISTVKDALALANTLTSFANLLDDTPTVDPNTLKLIINSSPVDLVRSELDE